MPFEQCSSHVPRRDTWFASSAPFRTKTNLTYDDAPQCCIKNIQMKLLTNGEASDSQSKPIIQSKPFRRYEWIFLNLKTSKLKPIYKEMIIVSIVCEYLEWIELEVNWPQPCILACIKQHRKARETNRTHTSYCRPLRRNKSPSTIENNAKRSVWCWKMGEI